MIEASFIFRILMTVILIVFASIFTVLFFYDRKEKTSFWIAIAFSFGLSAFLFDLSRSFYNPIWMDFFAKLSFWGFSSAWMFGVKEFYQETKPFVASCSVILISVTLLIWFSFVTPDVILRSIISSVTAGFLIVFCLPVLWCRRSNLIETTLFVTTTGLSASYFVRPLVVYSYLGEIYTTSSYETSLYAALLHASSAVFALACGSTILLVIGFKMIETHLRESIRDPLTKLMNRRGLEQYVNNSLKGRRSYGRAIIIVDLDHFKRVNDQYGHDIGDKVLIRSASALDSLIRGLGIIARIGGEEFVIILNKFDAEDIHIISQHLRMSVSMIHHPEIGGGSSVTASLGLALMSRQESFSMALRRADNALYQAKVSGRNQLFLAAVDEDERNVRLA